MRALIFLNGEFHVPPQNDKYDLVVCCDGAYDRVYDFPVDLFVGDGDSVTKPISIPRLMLDPVKDFTDGEAAVREAVKRGATEITLLGATGGDRIDQVLTNFYLLKVARDLGAYAAIVSENGEARLIDGVIEENATGVCYVSLVPIFGRAHIKVSEGLKYPIRDLTLDGSTSIGVSNAPNADGFRIEVDAGEILMVLIFSSSRESV